MMHFLKQKNFLLASIVVLLVMLVLTPLIHPQSVHGDGSVAGSQIVLAGSVLLAGTDPKTYTTGSVLMDTTTGQIFGYPMSGPKAYTAPIFMGTFQGTGLPIISPPQP